MTIIIQLLFAHLKSCASHISEIEVVVALALIENFFMAVLGRQLFETRTAFLSNKVATATANANGQKDDNGQSHVGLLFDNFIGSRSTRETLQHFHITLLQVVEIQMF